MSHNMAVISQQLRKAGYRVTPQRQFRAHGAGGGLTNHKEEM